MPRKKKTSAPDVAKAITPSTDPIKAGNRSRHAMKRAGLQNIQQACKLYDIEDRFANVYVAVGFADSISAQRFTQKQIHDFETIGRARLAALGVAETSEDIGNRTEVIVSLPITQQDGLAAFYALGLKRTGVWTSRGYSELRGAAVLETLKPLVAEMSGVLTVVERPATVSSQPESPAAGSEAGIQLTKEETSVATAADPDPAQVSPRSEIPNAVVVEDDGLLDGQVSRDDVAVHSATTPPNADASSNLQKSTYEVPHYVRRKLEEQAALLARFAPVAQAPSMADVISNIITEPTKSFRRQFRPPQPKGDGR
jgi:hypothetical protein